MYDTTGNFFHSTTTTNPTDDDWLAWCTPEEIQELKDLEETRQWKLENDIVCQDIYRRELKLQRTLDCYANADIIQAVFGLSTTTPTTTGIDY